jgi:hypothetical protein
MLFLPSVSVLLLVVVLCASANGESISISICNYAAPFVDFPFFGGLILNKISICVLTAG